MAQVLGRPADAGVIAGPPVTSGRAGGRGSLNTTLWRTFLFAVYLILFGPLVILLVLSFNDSNILTFPMAGFTTHWYAAAFHDSLLRQSLANSFGVAFVVAPLCVVLGTLAAFGLTRFRFQGRGVVAGLVGAPLILP